MENQRNRSVFITGATVNTGWSIAEKFAAEGYTVFLGSRSGERAKEAARELTGKYAVCSRGFEMKIFDEDNVQAVFNGVRDMGYLLDCLVLNAADLGIGQNFFDVPVTDFMGVINTNIGWNFMLARQAALQMREKGGGSIVFVNSNTAYRAIPDRVSYIASKNGALGMMRAMALDLGRYGIRVNAVLPGMIKTDRWESNLNGCRNSYTSRTPLGDIASGEDVANAVYYFGSGQSRNTTGAELAVDGGNMIRMDPVVE